MRSWMTWTRAPRRLTFLLGIDPDNFAVDPDAEVALLLDEIEEVLRLRLWRDRHPECEQNCLAREVAQHVIGNRLRGLGPDLAAAARDKRRARCAA